MCNSSVPIIFEAMHSKGSTVYTVIYSEILSNCNHPEIDFSFHLLQYKITKSLVLYQISEKYAHMNRHTQKYF